MKQILIAAIFLLGTVTSALSEAAADVAFVADAHMRWSDAEERVTSLRQEVYTKLQPGFADLGAEIINSDRFWEELAGDFDVELLKLIRGNVAAVYQEVLTTEEIAALADFYRADEGRVLLEQGVTPVTFTSNVAFFTEGAGAPLAEHLLELEASMEAKGETVTQYLRAVFSPARIADIIEMEDVMAFADESRRAVVAEALRNAE
ncbi:DUF2059 domain-containing protein [Leisingera sp. MMG026]|uniref:DUF2059 domain-containing protein n=1 Tax=Leisingera sp. MMG026 TaxID=2909982 RepID=UPI001F348B19|nr:DUF2059 domain-containing protein [Leisingera sp. MMG026]MCF6433873.1 DUF2059 domain-containing protein [Leisingera sp. MMG026]